MKKRLPKSVRKFIRKEKARIRREVLDIKKQNELIAQIYSKFLLKDSSTKINSKIKKEQVPREREQNVKCKTTNQNAK